MRKKLMVALMLALPGVCAAAEPVVIVSHLTPAACDSLRAFVPIPKCVENATVYVFDAQASAYRIVLSYQKDGKPRTAVQYTETVGRLGLTIFTIEGMEQVTATATPYEPAGPPIQSVRQ